MVRPPKRPMASHAASDALGDPTADDAPTKKRKIEIVDEPVDDGDEYVPEAPAIGDEWVERWAAARNKNTPATEPPESTQPAEDAPAPEIAAAPTPAPAASDAQSPLPPPHRPPPLPPPPLPPPPPPPRRT